MNRVQMFDTPHKALRLAFGQLLNQAGKTDFSTLKAVQQLKNLMADVFALVHSHSHSEDEICFPELDKIAPEATRHDRAEHIRLHQKLDDLTTMMNSIFTAVKMGQDEQVAGRALYTELCQLHAEMLIHMMEEERDTQPVFWQYMTDAELKAFEPRILGSMSPEISQLWLRYILPSAPHNDRVALLGGIRANAPAPVFEQVMGLAQQVLSEEEWLALGRVFEMEFA